MNSVLRVLSKAKNINTILQSTQKLSLQQNISRNLCWSMSNTISPKNHLKHQNSALCNCSQCISNIRFAHSKGERELVECLTEEIVAERKAQKFKTIPTEVDGFQVKLDGAEVTLTKKTDAEKITIRFNVNHTVDTDAEAQMNPNMDKAEIGELKSKPTFKVDLIKGDTTVCLLCSFIEPSEQEEGYNDIFGIDEISIYNGDWNENVYAVSGEVVDSYLYDLLLNYLEEKGISNEFVEKVSQYSTAYEHSAYIGLLEGLSKFVDGGK